MLEAWCEDAPPDTFWLQTKRTFAAALRARSECRRRDAERDLFVAYHAGVFSKAMKLRPFTYYLGQMRGPADASRGSMAVLGLFRTLQAKGVPMSIKRLN